MLNLFLVDHGADNKIAGPTRLETELQALKLEQMAEVRYKLSIRYFEEFPENLRTPTHRHFIGIKYIGRIIYNR